MTIPNPPSAEKVLVRKEWFGGFQYFWKNNSITEVDNTSFENLLSNGHTLIAPESTDYLPFPVRVNIDLTYYCNRNCIYCHSDSGPMKYSAIDQELTVDEICNVLSDCQKMGVFEVALTGGEPLLKPGIWEILDYVGGLKNLFSNLITNGTCINIETAENLAKCGVSKVNISLDGFSTSNDRQRWKGAYSEAIDAIKLLVQNKINVGVISVITKYNIAGFEDFIQMISELGVSNHNVSTLCDIGRAQNNWIGISYEDFVFLSHKISQIQKNINRHDYNLTFNDSLLSLGNTPSNLPIYSFNDAVPGWKCTIKAYGDVIYDRVWGRTLNLGNVRTKSIYEIWVNTERTRATHINDAYQKMHENEMLDIYARLHPTTTNTWHWLSALENYYAK